MQDFLSKEPIVDFLENDASALDFLADTRLDGLDDCFCDPNNGGCGHFLTIHSRGLVTHDRCLHPGCDCQQAVLSKKAHRNVKQELLP